MRILLSLTCLGIVCLVGCGIETKSTSLPIPATTTTNPVFNVNGAPTVDFVVPDMVCEDCCHDCFDDQTGVVDVKFDDVTKVATVAYNAETFDESEVLTQLQAKYPEASLAGVEPSDSSE